MALENAKLLLNLDRKNGTFAVDATSSRVYSQDENVALEVNGWTLDEVTKTSGKTPYEPYFRVTDTYGVVLAEAKLAPAQSPTPGADNAYSMFATLSTNTYKLVKWFANGGCQPGMPYDFSALVFATTEANPIATGTVFISAFDNGVGTAPSNLPTASEVLAAIRADLSSHTANHANPHQVTAAQVGAPSLAYADGTYATIATATNLQNLVNAANAAILALQSAMQTANLAIQSNTVALNGKANVANTYRKDETYSRSQVEMLVSERSASRLLAGKVFAAPANDRQRNGLIAYIVNALGGNMRAAGIEPGTAPSQITMTAGDGTSRNLKIVKVDGEYTTEVE